MSKAAPVGDAVVVRFFNRELSWIEFNARVLEAAAAGALLERLKFLAIASSNFDEFFMVRVAAVKRRLRAGSATTCPSGMSNEEQLARIRRRVRELVAEQQRLLLQEVLPGLDAAGLSLLSRDRYSAEQLELTRVLFDREIRPAVSPVRVERGAPLPTIASLKLHVAFLLQPTEQTAANDPLARTRRDGTGESDRQAPLLALVQVPQSLERLRLVAARAERQPGRATNVPAPRTGTVQYVLVEDVLALHAADLFPGYQVRELAIFRVTRDADLEIDEARDEDFIEAMEAVLENRRSSRPIRLEISATSPALTARLTETFELHEEDVFAVEGPLDLASLMDLAFAPGLDHLRERPWTPIQPPAFADDGSAPWEAIREADILLHHPYESFEPVVRTIQAAAEDPQVIAIKMTLYRTGRDSPIVAALAEAAERGKQVTVLVEIKARFDEEGNIDRMQQLERAGAIVVYGIVGLKVHAKALLVIRRESYGMRSYLHLSTGNYNHRTAGLYTDFGLFTARDELTREASQFFNAITGYAALPNLANLIMAPHAMKTRVIGLIERERQRHQHQGDGRIMAKMNSIADPDVITALYQASQDGVRIRLNVRGVCLLVPGMPGLSENIEVVSIVGRFLEHARIFYFHNGGEEEVFLSSADWMPRNLERRIELMFPVDDRRLARRLVTALETFFSDEANAHHLQMDGTYRRAGAASGRSAQHAFCEQALHLSQDGRSPQHGNLRVRRRR